MTVARWVMACLESADTDHAFCKWVICVLGWAFALVSSIAFNWIKSLIKENKDERNERLADLKDHYKPFKGKED